MAIRIKSRWWNEDSERSLDEIGGALAFIGWRIAVEKAINLHCERFVYADDAQRLAVIEEYLLFLVQAADRLTHGMIEDDARRELITSFAKALIKHVQDNAQDLLGAADYGTPFIAKLNQRSEEYAGLTWDENGPGYSALRHLGHEIQVLMGKADENRWVIDQVMDKDAPEAYKRFSKALRDLFE